MFRRTRPRPTFSCPNCGTDVIVGSASCRECGSDADTGWSEDTLYDDLDLPDPFGDLDVPAFRVHRKPALVLVVVLVVLFLWAIL